MQSEELLELTASERLSLEEEYEMQRESDVGWALFTLLSLLLRTAYVVELHKVWSSGIGA